MKPSLLSVLCGAFLVSQAHAQGLLQTHRIPVDLANQAVAAVVAKCPSQGYAETGVLVDADCAPGLTATPERRTDQFRDVVERHGIEQVLTNRIPRLRKLTQHIKAD